MMDRFTPLVAAVLVALVGLPGLAQGQGRYAHVAIAQPAAEETVHDNEGNVVVTVEVSPGLAPGDRIALFLDGQPVGQRVGTMFTLSDVERGTHTLEAQVIDANGATLLTSQPVTFYMWQASALFPGRRPPPPPTPAPKGK